MVVLKRTVKCQYDFHFFFLGMTTQMIIQKQIKKMIR
jgi:hypothetical protein